jgi:hypothetical protein
MRNEEAIIAKIKALLLKTTANGCTQAEMFAALAKARALRDAYEISDDDLAEAKAEAVESFNEPFDTNDPHNIKWHLGCAVGDFCGVKIFRSSGGTGTGLRCIGMKSDVDYALFLLEALADHVFQELAEHLVTCLAPNGERRVIMRTFVNECCYRISERLDELVAQSRAKATSNGRELVVVKDAAIKAYMKERGICLHNRSGSSATRSDAGAAAAGRAAGDRANFGRPVNGSSGVLRIGR